MHTCPDRGLRTSQEESPGTPWPGIVGGSRAFKREKVSLCGEQKLPSRASAVAFKQLLFFPEENCSVELPQCTFCLTRKHFTLWQQKRQGPKPGGTQSSSPVPEGLRSARPAQRHLSVPGAGWCSRSAPRSGAGGGTGEVSRLQPAGDGALRLRGKWRWACLTGVCHTRGEAVILLLSMWVNPLPPPPPPPCQYVFWDTGEGGAFLKDILSREKRRCASLYSGHNLKMKRIPLSLQGITQTCFLTGSWIS